jgi:hypothetical protein
MDLFINFNLLFVHLARKITKTRNIKTIEKFKLGTKSVASGGEIVPISEYMRFRITATGGGEIVPISEYMRFRITATGGGEISIENLTLFGVRTWNGKRYHN